VKFFKYAREIENMYDYILFDLDGTLTDSKIGITKSVQYALNHFKIDEPDLDKLICFIGPPLKASFMEYYGFGEDKAIVAIKKYHERFSTTGLFENRVYEGIPEMLQQLKDKNKVLAVATSKPEVFATRILDKYDLKKYFDVVVGSELDETRSNKAEVIQAVFEKLNITEEKTTRAIMVGDREHDIIGAKTNGIDSIGVEFGYAKENELKLAGAEYVIETVEDLKNFLLHN